MLDRAASEGADGVEFIHGIGTGALRRALREHLGGSPYVKSVRGGDPDHGGEGVTLAIIS